MVEGLDFKLFCFADRIDLAEDGRAYLYDYKTGKVPSNNEQVYFDKQLLLETCLVEKGAFQSLGPRDVAGAHFLGLSKKKEIISTPVREPKGKTKQETPDETWEKFIALLRKYEDFSTGYTSRQVMQQDSQSTDYDQLARYGEWDATELPEPEDLT
jgi:ATP-dependent helicase/nuclease subunit B